MEGDESGIWKGEREKAQTRTVCLYVGAHARIDKRQAPGVDHDNKAKCRDGSSLTKVVFKELSRRIKLDEKIAVRDVSHTEKRRHALSYEKSGKEGKGGRSELKMGATEVELYEGGSIEQLLDASDSPGMKLPSSNCSIEQRAASNTAAKGSRSAMAPTREGAAPQTPPNILSNHGRLK
eukprot:3602237-Pleurochrysis_carterae.AAC.2